MSQFKRICLARVASGIILAASAVAPAQTNAPDGTAPPAGQTKLLTVTGQGVQIYVCKQAARQTGSAPAWTFVAPEAKLLDESGAEVGSHGAGPMWKLQDGSEVHGKVIAQQALTTGAIPWLLLDAVPPKGPGSLAAARYIRRSETHGGTAPSLGCDAVHLGVEVRVPYTATYTFYGTQP